MGATRGKRRKRSNAVPILKGGDGGTLPTHAGVGGASPYADSRTNGRVYLTCQDPASRWPVPTFETADPTDRAHLVKEHNGMFSPAGNQRMVQHARPRKYPRSAMTLRVRRHPDGRREAEWIGWDSAFDDLYEMQQRLAGVPGLGRGGNASGAAAAREECVRMVRADIRLRDILEPNRAVYEIPTTESAAADEAEWWLSEHDPEYGMKRRGEPAAQQDPRDEQSDDGGGDDNTGGQADDGGGAAGADEVVQPAGGDPGRAAAEERAACAA